MNLAIVTGGFLPIPATKGGAVENLIQNYIEYNESKNNFDITIFSDYDEKAIQKCKKYKYTKVEFIKSNTIVNMADKITFFIAKNILKKENSHSYRFIFKRLNYLNQVSKKLKKKNYDKILLENHPTEYLALKWRKNYKKYENKYYYHCHNELPSTYKCKKIIDNTKKFICVSEFRLKTIMKYLNLPKQKFEVVKNGIKQQQFKKTMSLEEKEELKQKYNIKTNDKILIFTGRIVPGKGIKELIEALHNVNYKNYKMLIVGSALNEIDAKTQYQLEVENAIDKIKDKVIFTGFIKYEEIYKLYKIADIATLPSVLDDSAPLTIIEALTCGLPIITTDSGGIPEYANEKCAIILKRDKNLIDNLSKEINNLLKEQETRAQMSIESIKASEGLSMEKYCEDLTSSLQK